MPLLVTCRKVVLKQEVRTKVLQLGGELTYARDTADRCATERVADSFL